MTDPYDHHSLRDRIGYVLTDYRNGGLDGLEDAIEAIWQHPEFQAAWKLYQDTKPPEHGERREVGSRPMWWDAREQLWKWSPIS